MSDFEQYNEVNESRQLKSNEIIMRRTLYAAGTGLIPVPIVDAAALLGVQMYLVRDIAQLYGIEFKEQRVKSLIGALAGDVAAVSLFKFIPGIGTLLGSASTAVLGAAVTYALGKVFVQHFDNDGNFLNFDPVKAEGYFKEKIKEGQQVIKKIRRQNKGQTIFSSDDMNPTPKKENNNTNAVVDKENKKLSQEISALREELKAIKEQRLQQKNKAVLKEIQPKKKNKKIKNIDLDNLQTIKGIGPKIAIVLKENGICNISDLSKTTPEILIDILEKEEGKFILVLPDSWILQAQLIVGENFDALDEFQKKLSEKE